MYALLLLSVLCTVFANSSTVRSTQSIDNCTTSSTSNCSLSGHSHGVNCTDTQSVIAALQRCLHDNDVNNLTIPNLNNVNLQDVLKSWRPQPIASKARCQNISGYVDAMKCMTGVTYNCLRDRHIPSTAPDQIEQAIRLVCQHIDTYDIACVQESMAYILDCGNSTMMQEMADGKLKTSFMKEILCRSYDVIEACTKVYERRCGAATLQTSLLVLKKELPRSCVSLPHHPVTISTVDCSSTYDVITFTDNCLSDILNPTRTAKTCGDPLSKAKIVSCILDISAKCSVKQPFTLSHLLDGIHKLCQNTAGFNSTCVMDTLRNESRCHNHSTPITTSRTLCQYLKDESNCLYGLVKNCGKSTSDIFKSVIDHVTTLTCKHRKILPKTSSSRRHQSLAFFSVVITLLHFL